MVLHTWKAIHQAKQKKKKKKKKNNNNNIVASGKFINFRCESTCWQPDIWFGAFHVQASNHVDMLSGKLLWRLHVKASVSEPGYLSEVVGFLYSVSIPVASCIVHSMAGRNHGTDLLKGWFHATAAQKRIQPPTGSSHPCRDK